MLAIDCDEEAVREMVDYSTRAVVADATNEQALRALGIRNLDVVVVGIGDDLQASILVVLMLKEVGVEYIVAKAHNELHGRVLERIGADKVVYPERDMGFRVANSLVSSNILEYIELSPDVGVIEVLAPERMLGKRLVELDLRNRFHVNVIAIKRGNVVNIPPGANDRIERGDVVVLVGKREDLQKFDH